jgi:chromosome segregation ATPase
MLIQEKDLMTATGRLMAWLLAATLALAVGGCMTPEAKPDTVTPAAAPAEVTARRFQDTPLQGRTAMESAIEISEKYATLSDQSSALRQENQRLTTENQSLQQQMTALDAKLKQTQKELGEANDLLIEMLTELNTWKSNILGFRGEMRQAAQAQLEALLKVLEILGGQTEAGALAQKHAETLSPESGDVAQATQPAMPLGGEPNGTR